MKKLIKRLSKGGKPDTPSGTIKKIKGDPYEYAMTDGKYSYRKAGSNGEWITTSGKQSDAIRTKVYGHSSPEELLGKGPQYVSPDRVGKVGRVKGMTSEQSRKMDQSKIMDKVKEAVGWQDKSGKPGLVQGLARTVGLAGAGAAVGTYLPAVAAGYSASQLPGSYDYIKYAYTDQDANLSDKIMAPVMGGLNLAGLAGGTYGAIRQARAAIPAGRSAQLVEQQRIFDPYVNAGSQSKGMNRVKPQNTVVQSHNVKPQGVANVVSGGGARGKGGNTTIVQRPWGQNWGAGSTSKQVIANGEVVVPQSPFWAFGYNPEIPESVTPKPPYAVQRRQEPGNRTEILTPNSWGSEEFQKAFGEARKQGLEQFEFKGKIYGTKLGSGNPGKRYVGETSSALPEGRIIDNNQAVTIIPDSTSSINYHNDAIARILPGAITGNPKRTTVPISKFVKQ